MKIVSAVVFILSMPTLIRADLPVTAPMDIMVISDWLAEDQLNLRLMKPGSESSSSYKTESLSWSGVANHKGPLKVRIEMVGGLDWTAGISTPGINDMDPNPYVIEFFMPTNSKSGVTLESSDGRFVYLAALK